MCLTKKERSSKYIASRWGKNTQGLGWWAMGDPPAPTIFLETFIYRIVLDTLHTHQQTLVSRIWPLHLLPPLSWSQPGPLPSVLIREARGSLLKIKWVIAFLCWNSPMACFPYHSKQKSFTAELVPALSGARGDMEGDPHPCDNQTCPPQFPGFQSGLYPFQLCHLAGLVSSSKSRGR